MSDNITRLFIKPNAATNVQPARNYIYAQLRNDTEVLNQQLSELGSAIS